MAIRNDSRPCRRWFLGRNFTAKSQFLRCRHTSGTNGRARVRALSNAARISSKKENGKRGFLSNSHHGISFYFHLFKISVSTSIYKPDDKKEGKKEGLTKRNRTTQGKPLSSSHVDVCLSLCGISPLVCQVTPRGFIRCT